MQNLHSFLLPCSCSSSCLKTPDFKKEILVLKYKESKNVLRQKERNYPLFTAFLLWHTTQRMYTQPRCPSINKGSSFRNPDSIFFKIWNSKYILCCCKSNKFEAKCRLILLSVQILITCYTCYKHVWWDGHVKEKSMAGHLRSRIEL